MIFGISIDMCDWTSKWAKIWQLFSKFRDLLQFSITIKHLIAYILQVTEY